MTPLSLSLDTIARMLNAEIADHPVYDGIELQVLGDGPDGDVLAFLTRRDDGKADFYLSPGLELDPASFHIRAGIGRWAEARFEQARLELVDDGVVADLVFEDDAGRRVELHVDDRDGHPRQRSRLLAPVSAEIEDPQSMMFVYMTGFDLVRTSGTASLRIDGEEVDTGHLPLEGLHHHRLIKVTDGITVAHLNRSVDGPMTGGSLEVARGSHHAQLVLDPGLEDVHALPEGAHEGAWHLTVEGDRMTGGLLRAMRVGDRVDLELTVTERWTPHGLPPLVWGVTRLVPTFRQWPTTYRWTARIDLSAEPPTMRSAWTRQGDLADSYRRATGSA